ncbi:MAG: putative nucleotide-diphospho-sugar transferase [Opitutales bacterium]
MSTTTSTETAVVVSLANAAYARSGMVDNWLRSLRAVGIRAEVVVYALDREAQGVLTRQGVPCIPLPGEPGDIPRQQPRFRSPAWKRLVLTKLTVIQRHLAKNQAVLFSDLDVCFLRDPLDWLHAQTPKDGISLQSDWLCQEPASVKRLCSGFMYLRPGPRTMGVCDLDRADVDDFPSDQPLLNHRLRNNREAPFVELAIDAVPNGPRWDALEADARQAAYALHLSYVLGLQQKVKFLRKAGLWHTRHGRTEYWRLRTQAHLRTLRGQPTCFLRNLRGHLVAAA